MPTTTRQSPTRSPIGRDTARIDGPLKVTGRAQYTSDFHFPGQRYAVPVFATIAKGSIAKLDAAAAERMPGVRAVLHRENIGPIFRSAEVPDVSQGIQGMTDERRPPLADDVIRYYGQYVALVVADTYESAMAAADAIRVTYKAEQPNVDPKLASDEKPTTDSERGDPDGALAEAPVKLDQTYVTPVETHNPIELHSTTAVWDGPSLVLYESSQSIVNHRGVIAQMLGVPPEQVRVISKFIGSGFGGKLWPWTHSILAAVAARKLGFPVKLVVSRKMMFQTVGHRPRTQQRVRLGVTPAGKLLSLQHDFVNHTAVLDDYKEDCGKATTFQYSVPNLRVTSGLAHRNVGSPTSMRGPGEVPGHYAIESAMNELAHELKIDPVQLRVLNEPQIDEGLKVPFSSRHIVECYQVGAERFGWANRSREVGSMKRDGMTLGWGVAGCSWPARRFPAEASVELRDDGTARVACATQDLGTGTYTVLAQLVSEKTGVPLEKIDVALGDTALPPGPTSGGSMATASVIPAVVQACEQAIASLLTAVTSIPGSPFEKRKPAELAFARGRVAVKADKPGGGDRSEGGGSAVGKRDGAGAPFAELLRRGNLRMVSGSGSATGNFGESKPKLSMHSFGAHFVEVAWQPEIARLRVNRVVTVIDGGRIINTLAGRNQIEGAVVMGIGMALFEETTYDPRTGAPINSNLADYIVAVNADVPSIDVHFLDYPDMAVNVLGARGIGEIGLAGIAAAIADAVHHATGVRVRELPITIEKLW